MLSTFLLTSQPTNYKANSRSICDAFSPDPSFQTTVLWTILAFLIRRGGGAGSAKLWRTGKNWIQWHLNLIKTEFGKNRNFVMKVRFVWSGRSNKSIKMILGALCSLRFLGTYLRFPIDLLFPGTCLRFPIDLLFPGTYLRFPIDLLFPGTCLRARDCGNFIASSNARFAVRCVLSLFKATTRPIVQ